MSNRPRRIYKCTDPVLHTETGRIIAACGTYPILAARFPAGTIAAAQQLHADAIAATGGQSNTATELADLTTDQNDALATIRQKITLARDSGKRALRGQTVKLREQFGVGHNPQNLASITGLALQIHAGCVDPDNAPALATQGWIAADSDALETAILALTGADTLQEARKAQKIGGTQNFINLNNTLYAAATAIQNAARIQFPDETPASITAREIFRLGDFPPARPRDLPTIPRKFVARPRAPGTRSFKLDWNISKRTNDYFGTITNKSTGETLTTFTTTDNQHPLTLPDTTPGTEIQLTLTARNSAGPSKPTRPIRAVVP